MLKVVEMGNMVIDICSPALESDFAIKVDNLTKVYKLYSSPTDRLKEALSPIRIKYHHDFHALHDVSFEVKKGETVGIIGKNGSGKSTLLKIITGVLTPTSGTVQVKGRISALLELGAGFSPEMTGVENVYFNGTLMGYSREEMDSRLDNILGFADIGEFIYQPVKTYSSGMFIRLAFAVAINVEPEIMIIDEALSVGDAAFQAKCLTVIERFRQNGVSILYVTHDTGSIKSLCSRAVYLAKGHVSAVGNAGQISDQYIRDLREESGLFIRDMVCADLPATHKTTKNTMDGSALPSELVFKTSAEFVKKNGYLRYGTGEARCVNAEIMNLAGDFITHVDFDEIIIIRIYLECYQPARLTVNYMIRDAKNNNLIGSNFRIENTELIEAVAGDKYIVVYETRAPLAQGEYNLYVETTEPVILNKKAKFIDVIEAATVFSVLERPVAKIWSSIYIENTLTVHKIVSNPI